MSCHLESAKEPGWSPKDVRRPSPWPEEVAGIGRVSVEGP